ncbi:MAG: hypothetical protein U0L73_14000 [Ruminococcus bromii]|nr:hypothetical protein [Ruminococcus bromii]
MFLYFSLSFSVIFLITRHGFPAAKQFSGMSLVTTLPAPIIVPLPIFTPPHTVTFEASQQSFPISIGFAYSYSIFLPSGAVTILRSSKCMGE